MKLNILNAVARGHWRFIVFLLTLTGMFSEGYVFAGDNFDTVAGDQLNSVAKVRYVRENGYGTKDGSSWENASGNLQEMINASNSGDKVYVAAGSYYAIEGREVVDERNLVHPRQKAFVMKSGVSVYGGFNPAVPEMHEDERTYQLNARYGWQLKYISVLSGSTSPGVPDEWKLDTIGWKWQPVGYIDNVTHVVWFASKGFTGQVYAGEVTVANPLDQLTILDGFTIEGGYADGCGQDVQGSSARFGGGVYLVENGEIRNCVVRENYAVTRGGGVFMNYGGRVSDCFVTQNATPGYNQVRNGMGGGVYMVGKGLVERSFIVNNSARRGGGIYFSKEHHVLPYEAVVEMSVIANNTSANEGGGVYCDSAGVLTGTMIVRNNCMDPALTGNGKTGGIFINHYAVLTAVGIYGNVASMSSRQGYGVDVKAPDEITKTPASVQLAYSAIEKMSAENFGMATLKEVVDIEDNESIYAPRFIRNLQTAGLLPVSSDGASYLGIADWDKDPCSVFVLRGATYLEAPYFSETESKRVNIPDRTIDRKCVKRRPDVGPYISEMPEVKHAELPDGRRVVYVDNRSEQCGDGSSWSSPTRLLVPAMEYLAALGGGELWVKEGTFLPIYSERDSVPQKFHVCMRGKVKLYGGFPHHLASPGMADRDPVAYRTVLDGDIGLKGDYTDNSYHLVTFEAGLTDTAVLDGFTLRNANALSEPESHGKGGAVLIGSPYAVMQNCIIENCLALEGAAVWATQPFRMENCVVNNNDARSGAVISAVKGSRLINLTVVLNKGIGITGGEIVNTLVWGNTGITGAEQVQINGAETVSYSAVQSGIPGEGNVNLDPDLQSGLSRFINPTREAGMIIGGYGTVNGGPAVMEPTCVAATVCKGKAGTGYALTDIRGERRGRGGAWDIGAFESTCLPEDGIWYVRPGGNGSGTSWADAAGDIQEMVDKAKPGEQVWVAAGTYSHKGELVSVEVATRANSWKPTKYEMRYRYKNFVMKEGVNVYGGFPNRGTPGMNERRPADRSSQYCTILIPTPLSSGEQDNGYRRGRVLEQTGDYQQETVWDGFTIRDGEVQMDDGEDGGAGAKLFKNGSLVNCYITGNVNRVTTPQYKEQKEWWGGSSWKEATIQLRGGGVHCRGGKLVDCYITGNQVITLTENAHEAYGGGVYMTNGTAYNCVIVNNNCTGAYADGCAAFVEQADFYNNTIAQNTGNGVRVTAIRIGGFTADAGMHLMNCIIWGNAGTAILDQSGKLKDITYSFFEGAMGETNIYDAQGPRFRDAANGDFRLESTSPCINTGNTYPSDASIRFPETDMDYTERIKDCAIDMGAYEYGQSGEGTIVPDVSRPDTAIVYLTQNGSGRADGSSWEEAACRSKLQRAMDVLAQRKEKVRLVWLGTGKIKNTTEGLAAAFYYPLKQWDATEPRSRYFRIRPNVNVMGSFAGWERYPSERDLSNNASVTVLSGDFNETPDLTDDDAFHVVVFDSLKMGESSLLESVIVRNGNANHYDRKEYQSGGGVVVLPGGNLRNCAVSRCLALHKGGGVYLMNKDENTRYLPGAMVTGSFIKECQAQTGGGIYADKRAQVTQSTIVKNVAKMGGGIAFAWPAAIQGSVIWNNTAENGKDLYGMTDVPYEHGFDSELPELPGSVYPVNFCAVEGYQVAGQLNMMLSPENEGEGQVPAFENPLSGNLWNGGWRIKRNSALIDKGLNNTILKLSPEEMLQRYYLSAVDMSGHKRIHNFYTSSEGAYMDIGAYEVDMEIVLHPDEFNRLYVARSSRGKTDGSSWKNATSDLQAALDYFKDKPGKGEVWVQGGHTYYPLRLISGAETDPRATAFVLHPNVDLYGGFMGDTLNDPARGRVSETALDQRPLVDKNKNNIYEEYEFRYVTVLDGGINPVEGYEHNSYHLLYYEGVTTDRAVVIDGFTLQNGQAVSLADVQRHRQGGAIYATAPVVVRNCIFLDNYAVYDGGAVYAPAGGRIESCLLGTNGVMTGKGGGIYLKGGVVANTLVTNNTSQFGKAGGIYIEGGKVINSVVACNNATDAAGIYMQDAEIWNTVVWRNAIQTEGITEVGGSGAAAFCALPESRINDMVAVQECVWLGTENEALNGPHFISPVAESVTEAYDWAADWRIHTLSPLRDKGNSEAYTAESLPSELDYVQYAGTQALSPLQRIQGKAIDIGCYETKPVELADRDTLYVRTWEDPTSLADGSSWKNATSDLQAAIEKLEARPSRPGVKKQIWVAQGRYIPTAYRQEGVTASRSFVIRQGAIAIYGGFPDDGTGNAEPGMADRYPAKFVTVLDGELTQSRHVVYVEATRDIFLMDGVTIRGGRANGKGDEGRGAAVYLTLQADLSHFNYCIITENTASETGAALYAASTVYLSNSLIFRNNTLGLYTSYAELLNNTFVKNNHGGAVIADHSPASPRGFVRNCVFWGNTNVQLLTGNTPVVYSGVQDKLFDGEGNIRLAAANYAADGPRFAGEADTSYRGFELGCGSPLRDAGSSDGIDVGGYDLAGEPRILYGKIDIGAMESALVASPAKPDVAEKEIYTCQHVQQSVFVPNPVSHTKLYAIAEGWEIPFTDTLTIGAETAGDIVYAIVRADTTGCYSEADTLMVHVSEITVPANFTGTPEVCTGEDVILTFTPIDGYTYELFDQGAALTETSYRVEEGQVRVFTPATGSHSYQLRAFMATGTVPCVSNLTEPVVVTVFEDQASDGSSLILLEGGNKDICEGEEIQIVYQYQTTTGSSGEAVVLGLPSGVMAQVNTEVRTIAISGRPVSSFSYTVRTGGELKCASARENGVVKVNPNPVFELGK